MEDIRPQKIHWIDISILILITLIVFATVLKTPLSLLDDSLMLKDNPRYQNPTLAGFVAHFTQPKFNIFAPLTYAVWHIIAVITNTPSADGKTYIVGLLGFKIASLVVHCMSAVAVWLLIRQFVNNRLAVLVGAIIFAIHPMHVESVAWTTGLKDELCGLLSFLSITVYIKYLRSESRKLWNWTLVLVICASLSKPTAVILPVILLALDLLLINRSLEKRLTSVMPFFVPAIGSALVMIYIQDGGNTYSPIWARPLIALDALSFYFYKAFIPAWILPDYGRSPANIINDQSIYWTWILSATVFAWAIWKRNKQFTLVLILFVLPLLPILGLSKFDMQQYTTVTDHYMYQPLAAVGLLMAVVLDRYRRVFPVLFLAMIFLGVKSYFQLQLWREPHLLYAYGLQYQPHSLFLLRGMANYNLQQKRYEVSEYYSRRAIEVEPRMGDFTNLINVLIRQDRKKEASELAWQATKLGTADPSAARSLFNTVGELDDPELDEAILKIWKNLDRKNIDIQIALDHALKLQTTRPASTRPSP